MTHHRQNLYLRFIWITIAILESINVYKFNSLVTEGKKIQKIDIEIDRIRHENAILSIELAKQRSLIEIEIKAINAGFIPIEQRHILYMYSKK